MKKALGTCLVLTALLMISAEAQNITTTTTGNVTAIDPVTGNMTTANATVQQQPTGVITPKKDADGGFTLASTSKEGAFLKFSDGGLNFELYPDANATDSLTIKFVSVAEQDYKKAGVAGRTIGNLAGAITGATVTQGQQYGATYLQFMFTLSQIAGFDLKCPGATVASPDAWMTITIYVTSAATTIPYGGINLALNPGAAKFNVDLSGWPFCNTTNSLFFQFQIGSTAVAVLPKPSMEQDSTGTGHIVKTTMGNGQSVSFYMPSFGYKSTTDFTPIPCQPGLSTPALANPALTLSVPYFAGSFYYDPTSTITGTAIKPSPSPSPKRSPSPSPSPLKLASPSLASPTPKGLDTGISPAPLNLKSSAAVSAMDFRVLSALVFAVAAACL